MFQVAGNREYSHRQYFDYCRTRCSIFFQDCTRRAMKSEIPCNRKFSCGSTEFVFVFSRVIQSLWVLQQCTNFVTVYNREIDKSGYPPAFHNRVGSRKTQTSSPPVLTPNYTESTPDDKAAIPRPMQSMNLDLPNVRARLRVKHCRGQEGLHRTLTFVRRSHG